MPKPSSAQKTTIASRRKAIRNRSIRSALKTSIDTAERLIREGDVEKAGASATAAVGALDQAANDGVIHPNNAGRHKSRLMKKLNNALKP